MYNYAKRFFATFSYFGTSPDVVRNHTPNNGVILRIIATKDRWLLSPRLRSDSRTARVPPKCYNIPMTSADFHATLGDPAPPPDLPPTLEALWWDAKGDWARAHSLVDELESQDGMAVHAYLHRKEGANWNAEYWYNRAGRQFHHPSLPDEWSALVFALCADRPAR